MADPDSQWLAKRQRLVNQLTQGSVNDRRLALNELAESPSDKAVALLQELLNSPDFSLRKFAVMGLGNHPTDESFATLQAFTAKEKDTTVLAEAANSLYEFGDRAYPEFRRLYEAHDNWLLRQTIISLAIESKDPDLMWEFALLGLDDANQLIKEAAIFAFGQLLKGDRNAQAFETLEQTAVDPVWRTRWRTAIALQNGPKEQVQPLLLKLKSDEHFRVVAAALDVLNVI
ncbi:MAG: HEAT repeat domain-containing protein [Cyanobacteria bacterium P01_F01_bin.42]